MSTSSGTRRGRPRSPHIDRSVRRAVLALLDEVGYTGLTVDAVAHRAGVGKPAVYRRWPSKMEMVFAAVFHDADLAPPPDTGSLAGDLQALLALVIGMIAGPPARHLLPALLGEIERDPRVAKRFATTFVAVERGYLTELLNRAVDRGELPRCPDIALAHAQLLGPAFAALFLLRDGDPTQLHEALVAPLVASLSALAGQPPPAPTAP
jgi:AcrR family transcriptional regulator